MRVVHSLSMGDFRGLGAINTTLITMLLKRDEVAELKDFKSVSHEHGAVKILAKAMVNI